MQIPQIPSRPTKSQDLGGNPKEWSHCQTPTAVPRSSLSLQKLIYNNFIFLYNNKLHACVEYCNKVYYSGVLHRQELDLLCYAYAKTQNFCLKAGVELTGR